MGFMEDGNPNYLHDSHDLANIGKFRLITRTIEEIEAMKKLGYEGIIDPDVEAEKLILFAPRMDDSEEQYQHSITCEARKSRAGLSTSAIETPIRGKRGSTENDLRRISLPSKLKRVDMHKQKTLQSRTSEPRGLKVERVLRMTTD